MLLFITFVLSTAPDCDAECLHRREFNKSLEQLSQMVEQNTDPNIVREYNQLVQRIVPSYNPNSRNEEITSLMRMISLLTARVSTAFVTLPGNTVIITRPAEVNRPVCSVKPQTVVNKQQRPLTITRTVNASESPKVLSTPNRIVYTPPKPLIKTITCKVVQSKPPSIKIPPSIVTLFKTLASTFTVTKTVQYPQMYYMPPQPVAVPKDNPSRINICEFSKLIKKVESEINKHHTVTLTVTQSNPGYYGYVMSQQQNEINRLKNKIVKIYELIKKGVVFRNKKPEIHSPGNAVTLHTTRHMGDVHAPRNNTCYIQNKIGCYNKEGHCAVCTHEYYPNLNQGINRGVYSPYNPNTPSVIYVTQTVTSIPSLIPIPPSFMPIPPSLPPSFMPIPPSLPPSIPPLPPSLPPSLPSLPPSLPQLPNACLTTTIHSTRKECLDKPNVCLTTTIHSTRKIDSNACLPIENKPECLTATIHSTRRIDSSGNVTPIGSFTECPTVTVHSTRRIDSNGETVPCECPPETMTNSEKPLSFTESVNSINNNSGTPEESDYPNDIETTVHIKQEPDGNNLVEITTSPSTQTSSVRPSFQRNEIGEGDTSEGGSRPLGFGNVASDGTPNFSFYDNSGRRPPQHKYPGNMDIGEAVMENGGDDMDYIYLSELFDRDDESVE